MRELVLVRKLEGEKRKTNHDNESSGNNNNSSKNNDIDNEKINENSNYNKNIEDNNNKLNDDSNNNNNNNNNNKLNGNDNDNNKNDDDDSSIIKETTNNYINDDINQLKPSSNDNLELSNKLEDTFAAKETKSNNDGDGDDDDNNNNNNVDNDDNNNNNNVDNDDNDSKEAMLSSKSEERSRLRTKRESLKEFFLQKQPYNINKDKSKGEHETLKLNNIKIFTSTDQTEIKEEIVNKISVDESGVNSIEAITTTKIVISDSSKELSPDEKRQRAAATRSKQNMELKNLMKQKKREQNLNNNDETIMFVPKNLIDSLNEQKKKSVNTTAADVESDGSVDLDDLIGQVSDLESGTVANLEEDDDLCDDNDDFWKIEPDEILRNLTPSTTPLATPLRGPSPNSQFSSSTYNLTRPTSTIAEEDENLSDTPLEVDKQEADDLWKTSNTNKEFDMESKEEDELDLLLDTEIMPNLKTSSPSPVLTPNSSLSGGKMGIPPGLSKSAFYSLSYVRSPLSPNSSQASSVVDPEEFETLSNGSHTSTSSRSISASGIRRPSNTTGIRSPSRNDRSPSKIARSGALSPMRPRSLSRASNSSAEESTTSSIGGAISPTRIASPTRGYHLSMYNTPTSFRQRSISGVSSSSADEILSRPQTSPPTYRSLSRIGGNIGGNKSSTSTDSPKQIRSSLPPPSSSTKNNAKTSKTGPKRPTSQPASSNITSSGLLSPSSRTGITNSRNNNVPANGSLNRFGKPAKTYTNSPNNKNSNNSNSNINNNNNNKSPSNNRTPKNDSRKLSIQSADSHDEHSGSSMIFSPPESPVGSSETESLTSLTSTMSYGSSAGRVASPSQIYNTSSNFSMLPSPTNFSDKKSATITAAPTVVSPTTTTPSTSTSSKLPTTRQSSKLPTSGGHTGIKIPTTFRKFTK